MVRAMFENWEEAVMKIRALAAALALVAFSAPALAFHCPNDMAKIDAALAGNPDLSADQMAHTCCRNKKAHDSRGDSKFVWICHH